MSSPATGGIAHPILRQWVLPIVAVLLTGVAAGVMLWNLQTRQSQASTIPVAIVNSDKSITTGSGKDEKTIYAGRQLAANLTHPDASTQTPLSWILVDQADADKGLVSGTYYAVLSIPQDFSKNINSLSGKNPVEAKVKLVSNDASSTAVAGLANLAVQQAAIGLGQTVTTNYTTNSLNSFTDIHNNLTSSAKSGQQLADSSHEIADSSKQIAQSSSQLSSGAGQLASGTSSLASGAESLSAGAEESAAGAAEVASGARQLDTAAGRLDSAADEVSEAAGELSTGVTRVNRLNRGLDVAARAHARGLDQLNTGRAQTAVDATRQVRTDLTAILRANCPDPRDIRQLCKDLRRLDLGPVLAAIGNTALVKQRVDTAATVAGGIATGAEDAFRATTVLSRGATGLATATDELADGVGSLDTAAGTLASGAGSAATGAESVATGAGQTASGANEINSSADQLASGASQLASGADSLADGSKQLASGADSLASGLDNGAKQVPDYTKDQVTQISKVVTTPVGVTTNAQHGATVAASLVPVLVAVALWLGTLMMFLVGAAVPTSQTWAQASAGRRVLLGWLPAVGVGVAQTALLLGLVLYSGIKVHNLLGLTLFCVLGALSFAATNQALVALFGGFGRLISLAFAVIEAAALGRLAPIEAAPGAIQLLNGILPLPQFVNGASELVIGGFSGDVIGACVVLAGWMFASIAVSVIATGRKGPRLAAATADPPSRPLVTSDQPA